MCQSGDKRAQGAEARTVVIECWLSLRFHHHEEPSTVVQQVKGEGAYLQRGRAPIPRDGSGMSLPSTCLGCYRGSKQDMWSWTGCLLMCIPAVGTAEKREGPTELSFKPSFPICPDFGKLLTFSKPQFPHLKIGIIILTSWAGVKIKWKLWM